MFSDIENEDISQNNKDNTNWIFSEFVFFFCRSVVSGILKFDRYYRIKGKVLFTN